MNSSLLKLPVLFINLLLISVPVLYAQEKRAIDQLKSVNVTWNDQAGINPALFTIPAKDLTEQQLLQFHLQQTEQLLKKRNPKGLTILQKKNREANLNVLHGYWQKGIFPVNDMHAGRQPYFIDKFNTYCAVGYLMQQSGADEMAKDINRSQNYNYLTDITHPDLMDWVYNSGLSLDELALIQPGYGDDWPVVVTELHYNNTGTDENEYIEVHQHGGITGMNFEKIFFYDHLGVLYKILQRTDMQSFGDNPTYYHYLFPANESFADSGKIEFLTDAFPYQLTCEFIYNSTGITTINHSGMWGPMTKTYSVIEDENVPVGSTLTYCGRYWFPDGTSTWAGSIMPATMGFLNPCVLVPINLSSFTYAAHSKTVELKWETSSQSNTDYFIVERSSDGINFTPVGKVKAAGTVNTTTKYSLSDNNPGYINHYRLKQVDLDGSFSFSQILYVKFLSANPIRIVTNPVNEILNMQINSAGNLLIYDFYGRKMIQGKVKAGSQQLNVCSFPSGKYMLQLQTSIGEIYNQPFIKQ